MTADVHGHRRVVCARICSVKRGLHPEPGEYVETYVSSVVAKISTIGLFHASEHDLYLTEAHPKFQILARGLSRPLLCGAALAIISGS